MLVERVREVFGADVVRILLRDHDDELRFTVGAASGLEIEPGTPVEIGDVLQEVVESGRPLTLDELPPAPASTRCSRRRAWRR